MKTTILLALTSSASAHFAMTYPWWRGDSFETQWTYPCGGVDQSTSDTNRTKWPLSGGAVAFEPSHPWAQTYINLGLGSNVTRLNITLVPPFNQTSNGTFCFPKVPLPEGVEVKDGDKATIQVIQLSASGGALYNCADIEFSEDAQDPSEDVCFNSTGVGAAELDYDGAEEEGPSGTGSEAIATQSSTPSSGNAIFVPGTVVLAAGVVAALMV